MDQGGLAISPNGRYVLYAGGRDSGQLRIMDVTNPSDPLTVHVEPLGLHKLGLAAAMGIAFRGDIFLRRGRRAGRTDLQLPRPVALAPNQSPRPRSLWALWLRILSTSAAGRLDSRM
jgi:hypothetical protein